MRVPAAALVGAVWLAIVAGAGPASAQYVAGDIAGRVRDETGVPIAGAAVSARNVDTGFERSTSTGADGRFFIPGVPAPGAYDVRVEARDFAPAIRAGILVQAGTALTLDFVLTIAIGTTVVVAEPGERHEPGARQDVGATLVRSLPLFGRDFMPLASLAAGFTGYPDYPSPQGQIYWAHNVLVDGASHVSKWRGAPRAFSSGYALESIEEVQILTNVFSAEFGDALASITNVVTKAGTNAWRGAALLFVHDDVLAARSAFAPRTPPGGSQQFGFSLGGPLVRDRAHIQLAYEGRRARSRNVVTSPAASGVLVPDDRDEHLLFARVDEQLSARHAVTARYSGQLFDWRREPGGLVLPGSGIRYTTDVHTVLVTDRVVLGTGTLNELRFQGARYVDVRKDLSPSVFISRAGYSLEGGTLGPVGLGAAPEDAWEAADVVSRWFGSHALKIGGGARYVRAHVRSHGYGYGAYYFAGPPDLFPEPFLFVQAIGGAARAATSDPRSLSAFLHAHDEWSLQPRLTMSLGARYDIERVSHVHGYAPRVDRDNLQPRAGLVWDVTGAGRSLVRAGAGVYTQQHLFYPITRVELEGADGTVTVALGPESPLMPVFPAALALETEDVLPPRDVHRVDPAFRNPYAIQALIGLRQRLPAVAVTIDYVRLRGHDLMSLADANAPASNAKPAQRDLAAADATRPLTPAPGTVRGVITLGNLGRSWYDALQVKADRSSDTWHMVASYTLSRADDLANYQLPEDSRDLQAEKGPAAADVRHNFTGAATWIPQPAGGRLSRGWTVSALAMFRSGRPYTMTWGDDRNGTSQRDARPGGRNTARTGPFRTVDLAVARRFDAARATVEARVEAFNIFNAVNYDQYVGQLLSPFFSRPQSAFPMRRIQLAAIVRF
ncbi:MAG: TonB-dependent receptor [Acidobacteria bacterium]|nr:TonB-dependent receptor [Acidobacteriota bacterium]